MIQAKVVGDITDAERYSFSKLSSIWQCPYSYDLSYNYGKKGEQNCFAECGSFVHEIIEKYLRGELLQFELKDYFLENFKEAVPGGIALSTAKGYSVPLTQKYIDQISDFLEKFDGFYIDGHKLEVIDVEKKFVYVLEIADETRSTPIILTGILDVVAKDVEGNLYILDHKSKAGFKNKEERDFYARQLYLYSIYIKHKFGKYPKALVFDMFRIGSMEVIPFSKKSYEEALQWAVKSIDKITQDELFLPVDFSKLLSEFRQSKAEYDELSYSYQGDRHDSQVKRTYRETKEKLEDSFFFCMNLCNHRELCDSWKTAQSEYLEILEDNS